MALDEGVEVNGRFEIHPSAASRRFVGVTSYSSYAKG